MIKSMKSINFCRLNIIIYKSSIKDGLVLKKSNKIQESRWIMKP